MYLLDTNVVSELRRRDRADAAVLAWVDRIDALALFLSAMSLLELELGARLVARRDAVQGTILSRWIEEQIVPVFDDRILPVDVTVARRAAALHVPDRRPERDALIAATAAVHHLTVVTRNVRDFAPMGLPVFNPWQSGD
jgi:predicted nucleic acid-binding protein